MNTKLSLSGGTMTGTITSQAITPSSTNTYNIGSTSSAYANIHSKNYYLIMNSTDYGRFYISTTGTTSAVGTTYCILGNATASGTANNSRGYLRLYGTSSGYTQLQTGANSTSNVTLTLPSSTGTLALTSNLSSYLPLSGGTLTGVLRSNDIKPSTANTNCIGDDATPYLEVYAQDYYILDDNSNVVADFYRSVDGTNTTVGKTYLNIGNSTSSGYNGNSQGFIRVYGSRNGYVELSTGAITSNYNVTLPSASGKLGVMSLSGTTLTITI